MLATPPLIGAPVACWDCGAVLCGVVTDSGFVACQACGAVTGRRKATTDEWPRCVKCRQALGSRMTRPWSVKCPRCKEQNAA